MKTLKNYLDYTLKAAQNTCFDAKTFYNQAFGAVQYHLIQFPQDECKVIAMWEDKYEPMFEKEIYGKM